MIQTMEQEDLGVLAPSSSLSPLSQRTKRVKRKRILSRQHEFHDNGKCKKSFNMVVTIGPEPSSMSWLAQGSTDDWEVASPDRVPKGTTVEAGESIAGVDSSRRTPLRRTL